MRHGHNRTVDWYLLGMMMYELLVGVPPYYSSNRTQLFENIKNGPLLLPKNISENAKNLLKSLLCRNPKKRLGAVNDAKDVKGHEWFSEIDWEKVYNKELAPPAFKGQKIEIGSPLKMKFREDEVLENGLGEAAKFKDWTIVVPDEVE